MLSADIANRSMVQTLWKWMGEEEFVQSEDKRTGTIPPVRTSEGTLGTRPKTTQATQAESASESGSASSGKRLPVSFVLGGRLTRSQTQRIGGKL